MRNLRVLRSTVSDANAKFQNAKCFTICPGRDTGIFLVANGSLVYMNGESHEGASELSLVENGYLHEDGSDRVVSLEYVTEHDAVCMATSSGEVLLYTPSTQQLECMGCVDSGLNCMSWSPDQEVVVFITGSNTMILMSKDFDPLLEVALRSDEFGEGAFVNVGWGKKETQFHGSEGKPGAKTTDDQVVSKALPWDDQQPRVSWRGDGQYFVCSTVHIESGARQLHVYNREGLRQSTSEPVDGLEQALSWKPSGSLIASTQRKPHRHDVVFFEKNGLTHGEFTLPVDREALEVRELQWNADSTVLALWVENLHKETRKDTEPSFSSTKPTVQMWSVGNYHWYLKQEIQLPHDGLVGMMWDPELLYRIHFLTSDGRYIWMDFCWTVDQSKGHCEENNATVAVIDGAKVLLTPFKHQVVPPPMAAQTLTLPCSVNQIAFSPSPCCDDMLVLSSDNTITLFKQNKSPCSMKHAEATGFRTITPPLSLVASSSLNDCLPPSSYMLRRLIWWTTDTLLSVVWQVESRSDCIVELSFQVEESSQTMTVEIRHQCPVEMSVLQLETNADTRTVVVELVDGSVMKYNSAHQSDDVPFVSPWQTNDGQAVLLPLPCPRIETAVLGGEEVVLGLSEWARFYVNGVEVVRDCTSFAVHDEFILLTTHSHTCRFIPLSCSLENVTSVFTDDKSGVLSELIRRVERGSRIVTVVSGGSKVVLQMPRGNLETLYPRALLLSYVRKEIDRRQYGSAFGAMRKHRINMNLLYDRNPNCFLESLDLVINHLELARNINLFLSDLKDEDVTQTMYRGWSADPSRQKTVVGKVDRVCDALRNHLEAADCHKFMLSILMTHVKKTKPELEEALLKIQSLHDGQLQSGGVSPDDALKFLAVLVDVNQLYNVALGMYDLKLVLMVAEKSQKDPKEYLPFLNGLRRMGDYEKYQIDCHLKRYLRALEHISRCGDETFEECLELIKKQVLYSAALELLKQDVVKCKRVAAAYGEHLVEQDRLEDAGLVLYRYGHLEASLGAFEKSGCWRLAFTVAFQLKLPEAEIVRLARSLSDFLQGRQKYGEAAQVLHEYASDSEEAIVCLITGSLWEDSLRLIHRLERHDLIETHLRPALLEGVNSLGSSIDTWREQFDRHRNRLTVVREEKAQAIDRLQAQAVGDIHEQPGLAESDLYSDTSSVTGQSSRSSNYSRSTARSSKNRRKAERKKHRLKEGSPYEETALLEALGELWTAAHGVRHDVSTLVRMLVLYGYDVEARNLQWALGGYLDHMDSYKEHIWLPQATQTFQVETGPWMTTNAIVAAASQTSVPSMSESACRMPDTEALQWKLALLET